MSAARSHRSRGTVPRPALATVVAVVALSCAALVGACSSVTTDAGPAGAAGSEGVGAGAGGASATSGAASAVPPSSSTGAGSPGTPSTGATSGTASGAGVSPSASPSTPGRTASLAPGATVRRPTLPPANVPFDYQLGGAYPPAAGVRIVDRDRTAAPAPGRYNICYLNGFQTQPGEAGAWPADVLLRDPKGRRVADPDWPDEFLLDTRTSAARATIARVVRGWAASCARRGFQAVEIDNLDTYTRTPLLTKQGNLALARLFVRDAHALGLAIGQKNTVEIAAEGRRSIGFDFAIAEECQAYDECAGYISAYGARVYDIEYPDNGGAATFRAACAAHGSRVTVVYRDRDVVPKGRPGYVNKTC